MCCVAPYFFGVSHFYLRLFGVLIKCFFYGYCLPSKYLNASNHKKLQLHKMCETSSCSRNLAASSILPNQLLLSTGLQKKTQKNPPQPKHKTQQTQIQHRCTATKTEEVLERQPVTLFFRTPACGIPGAPQSVEHSVKFDYIYRPHIGQNSARFSLNEFICLLHLFV